MDVADDLGDKGEWMYFDWAVYKNKRCLKVSREAGAGAHHEYEVGAALTLLNSRKMVVPVCAYGGRVLASG